MKVAIVGPAFPYKGGGAHHTTELAHRLAAAGHDVTLESWRAQYPSFLYPGLADDLRTGGDARSRAPTGALAWYRPDGWYAAGRRLRSCDLVVLVLLSPVQVPAYLGIMAGLRRGARTVALCHNVLPHERKPYDRPLMRALLGRVDGVLVHSAEQAGVAESLFTTPTRCAELPAHLPVVAEHAAEQARSGALRNRLLFFGMIRPYKGLDILLRAMAAGPPEVSLTVAGEFWGGLDETRALIDSLGLADRVTLRPGYVPAAQVPELFDEADALVLPYRSATASQNVFMAFEHGVPVIATKAGTLADHVRDGVDGLVCEPDDVGSLTDVLKRFYAPGEPARLRKAVHAVDPEPAWNAYLTELLAVAP